MKELLLNHYVRLKKTSGILTLFLLIVNQALLIAGYMTWREINVYVLVPIIATGLLLAAIVASYVLWVVMGLYHAEAGANIKHNPVSVYAMNPWQECEWRYLWIPWLEAERAQAEADGNEEAAEMLTHQIDRLERWADLGHIPKDEYPEHLRKFYLTEEGAL